MTPPRIVALDAAPAQPWRNGGGRTRELLAHPPSDAWRVRVSVADIDRDGPFSAFPGVARWFCVMEGAGVALRVDGVERRLVPGDAPFAFDGAARTECALLDGPTRDLNLMVRGVAGGMVPARAGRAHAGRPGACGLFTMIAGRLHAEAAGAVAVPARTLAWFDSAPGALRYVPDTPETPDTADATLPAWWLWCGIDTTEDA